MIAAAGAGRLKLLWIFHHDLSRSAWAPRREVEAALATADDGRLPGHRTPIARARRPISCCRARPTSSAKAPSRISRAASSASGPRSMPLGEARPDWEIVSALARGARPARPGAHLLARRPGVPGAGGAVPAYAGMSYRALGDGGLVAGVMSVVAVDLLARFGPVAFTMFVVLNLGGHLDLGGAQAVGRSCRTGSAPTARRSSASAPWGCSIPSPTRSRC